MASRRSADLPEVYSTNLPEVVPSENSYRNGAAASSLPEVVSTPNPENLHGDGTFQGGKKYEEERLATATAGGTGTERRICGLKQSIFFGLIIGAVIIIGAIVGGAVGGTVGKKSSSSDASSSESGGNTTNTPKSSSISPSLNLASVNYTDSSGHDHYYVFYQDRSNNIIRSFWDSENKTWEVRSLSASLKKTSVDLSVNKGAPITALAWSDADNDWNLKVYVLSSSDHISELDASDISLDAQWSLDSQVANAGKASNIAAWRPNGGNSSYPPICLLGQNNQRITYTNGDGQWTELQTGTASNGVTAVNGTSLAVTTICSYCNSFEWKFYFHVNSLQEYSVKNDLTSVLADNALDTISTSSPNTNFAAVNFNRTSLFVINIDDDNALKARWWNNVVWSDGGAPSLNNSPKGISASSNFTAIAANADRRVHGIVDGEIYEWEFSETKPMEWSYKGLVNTTLSS